MSEHSDENDLAPVKDDSLDTDTIAQINNLLSNGRDEAPAFNMRLIAEVKARPHLYDHTNEGYNVTPWRNAAWQEIADALETTPESVKTRWKTLRDRFKKEEKKEKTTGKASAWVFQKPLKFVQRLVTAKLEECAAEEDEQVSPMEAAISFIEQEIIRNGNDHPASTSSAQDNCRDDLEVAPPPSKRTRISLTDTAAMFSRPSPRPAWPTHEDEEDEMFSRMISARLGKLPTKLRDTAKIRMLSVLYEISSEQSA